MLKRPEEILAQLSPFDQEGFDKIVKEVSEELNKNFDGGAVFVWVDVDEPFVKRIWRTLKNKFSNFGWVISVNDTNASCSNWHGNSVEFKVQEKPPSHVLRMGFD